MKRTLSLIVAASFIGLSAQSALADDGIDVVKLFNKRCKMCHSIDKKKAGPAVKYMNADPAVLKAALTTERIKMMQSVIKKLGKAEVTALVSFIQSKHESKPLLASDKVAETPELSPDTATTQALVPLCQGCHGANGEGREAGSGMLASPRLAGQIRSYLVQTLKDYKKGVRSNPMMGAVAKGLSDADITNVAAYYAELD